MNGDRIIFQWKGHLKAGERVSMPCGALTVPVSDFYTITMFDGGIFEVRQNHTDEVLEWEEIDACDEEFLRSISS